ncbi:MAG: ATP-binding cassette domain-containing protein [Planctomycetes bacterium]|nr:ATP-binding cassette domain-containing protein [Planctomycetota bacterium]
MSQSRDRRIAVIHLENVRVSFPNPGGKRSVVLDLPKWDVSAGRRIALRGPSGSGKSTLLNVLAGLLVPESGLVQVAGVKLSALSEVERDRFRAQNVGFVFQAFHLLDCYTALENIELGAAFSGELPDRERAEFLLKSVGLIDHAKFFPRQLSTGQQARVALARALATRPKLLLTDEPTGSLDIDSGKRVLDILFQTAEQENITIVCATHDLALATHFDASVSVSAGRFQP